MVWVVEWQQPEYGYKVTVFATEADATSSACYDMMEEVRDWDLSDSDLEEVAKRINDYVLVGDYKQALREFNNNQGNSGSENAMYFFVYERQPIVGGKNPRTIIFQDTEEDEGEDEEEDEEEDAPETPYTASIPGATCRGPCGHFSEYAYADRRDGTYCCYSCKMMSQVFGGNIS